MQGRAGNRGKGGINSEEADGWHKQIPATDSPIVVSTAHIQTNSNVHVHDRHKSVEASEKSGPYPQSREEKESAPPGCDPSDYQAQVI